MGYNTFLYFQKRWDDLPKVMPVKQWCTQTLEFEASWFLNSLFPYVILPLSSIKRSTQAASRRHLQITLFEKLKEPLTQTLFFTWAVKTRRPLNGPLGSHKFLITKSWTCRNRVLQVRIVLSKGYTGKTISKPAKSTWHFQGHLPKTHTNTHTHTLPLRHSRPRALPVPSVCTIKRIKVNPRILFLRNPDSQWQKQGGPQQLSPGSWELYQVFTQSLLSQKDNQMWKNLA